MTKIQMYAFLFFLLGIIVCIQSSESVIKNDSKQQLASIDADDNFDQYDSNDVNPSKLLSVERQIAMTKQMLQLYEYRLKILLQLKYQMKKQITQNRIKYNIQQSQINSNAIINDTQDVIQQTKTINQLHDNLDDGNNIELKTTNQKESSFYILLDQYQISGIVDKDSSDSSNQSSSFPSNQIKNQFVLIPPFIIDKNKSYVTLIRNLNDQKELLPEMENTFYDFSTSNRLLFYSLQKDQQTKSKYDYSKKTQKYQIYVLNLALQIKPNKIKSVKIIYISGNHSSKFQVQEQVTSYESHNHITQNFKWHNALEFDNLIIGFENQSIFIKEKDKKMDETKIGSKVIELYSLNQYKVMFVAENKIGTINVRSFTITEEIRFQHYLGNRTLIKQKQYQKHKQQSQYQETAEDDYLYEFADKDQFWNSPFSKKYSQIRAISVYNLEVSKQFLILLSNGDLILYSNDRIMFSAKLGTKLMKELTFKSLKNQNVPLQNVLEHAKIKLDIMPGYNYALVSSNWHSKLLIFNITIPHLSHSRGVQGFSFFGSSFKENELSCKYWLTIDFPQFNRKEGDSNNLISGVLKQQEIYIYVRSSLPMLGSIDSIDHPKKIEQMSVIAYYCHIEEVNSQRAEWTTQQMVIQQYRLLQNLFDNHFANNDNFASASSQGKSYWWNILMIILIILGVLIFRKCKQLSSQKNPFQYEEKQNYQNFKSKPLSSSYNNLSQSKKRSNFIKNQSLIESKKTQKNQQQYGDRVISQLQSYFQKQGQKLSKEQLTQLVREFQDNDEQQSQFIKPKMRKFQSELALGIDKNTQNIQKNNQSSNTRQNSIIPETRKKEFGDEKRKKE